MDLLLIRHAEPVRVDAADGPADPSLHERGHDQARRLADWLSAEHLDALWCSPLRRAVQTAEPLSAATGIKAEVDDLVAEYDRGSSSYIPIEQLRATKDERWQAIVDGRYFADQDGAGTFLERVTTGIDRIVADNPGRRVALIAHGGVINFYLATVLGIEPALFFEPRYASISRVAISRTGIRNIVSINETGHLRGLPGFEPPTA